MAEIPYASFLPLFDRLATPEQASTRPYLDEVRLKASIQQELQRLLSCRSALRLDAFLTQASDVLDYGIPDSTALTMASVYDRASLAKAIQRAITVFETRLRDVTVEVMPAPVNGVDALVHIEGVLPGLPTAQRTAFALTASGHLRPGQGIDGGAEAHLVVPAPPQVITPKPMLPEFRDA